MSAHHAWLLLAAGLAGGCGADEPAVAALPVRLGTDAALRVTQPEQPARPLFRLQPGRLERGRVARPVPELGRFEQIQPHFDADGHLLLPLNAAGASQDRLLQSLRADHALEANTAALFVVLLDVDPGARLHLRGRASAGPADPGGRIPATFHLVELASRPRSEMWVLHDMLGAQGALAQRFLAVDAQGAVDEELDLHPSCRAVAVLAGPLGENHGRDVVLAELEVRDTGQRADPPEHLQELSVDSEMRRGVLLSAGATWTLFVPATQQPARLSLGLAPLSRPGDPVVTLSLMGREDPPLRRIERSLPRPARPAAERWHDVSMDLPAGWTGRFEIGLLPDPEGAPVTVAVSAPLLLARDGSARATPERPNLLLVSIDTLRADALTRNGGHPQASPALDRFAASGVSFERCVAPAPYTLPSHVTMLSGQQPVVHGVAGPGRRIAEGRTPLLAEACREAGLVTAAFTGGGYLDHRYGFGRGFDRYGSRDEMLAGADHHLRWLADHADQRFFLFVHTYAVHEAARLDEPYVSRFDADCQALGLHGKGRHARLLSAGSKPLRPEELAHLRRSYQGALRQADDQVARLLARLEQLGLTHNTVVLITSDHGKEIGERGLYAHGHSLYDELLMVPLFLAGPGTGLTGRSLQRQVGVMDIAPTLLQLLGLPPLRGIQGRSLLPALRGEALPARPIVAEVDAEARKTALRWETGKLIHGPPTEGLSTPNWLEWELFDLAADPGERANRAASARALDEARSRLHQVLEPWQQLARDLEDAFGGGGHELTADQQERLRELGYLGG